MEVTNESIGRKKICIGAEADVISTLPLNVVESILERMPYQYAVRTSVFAKRWRYMWTSMTKLVFEGEFYNYLQQRGLISAFAKIVGNTLLLHDESPIESFSVHVRIGSDTTMGDIYNWILFLSKKGIKEFTLKNFLFIPMMDFKMSSSLFTCQNLTHLDLSRCVFLPPPTFTGFPNLLRLELHQVSLNGETFPNFVSNSPLLEAVRLKTVSGIVHFHITSPCLNQLDFESELSSINMKAENLRRLSLSTTDGFRNILEMEAGDIIDELSKLKNIEKLFLGAGIFQFNARSGTPMMLGNSLNCLKDITFHLIDLQDPIQISFAVCIMRSAPNLQQLEIRARHSNHYVVDTKFSLEKFSLDDCELNNLHVVNLPSFQGSRSEMKLVECLLASCPNLKLMFIGVDGSVDERMESKISKELLLLSRASPKAVIRISNAYEELE